MKIKDKMETIVTVPNGTVVQCIDTGRYYIKSTLRDDKDNIELINLCTGNVKHVDAVTYVRVCDDAYLTV